MDNLHKKCSKCQQDKLVSDFFKCSSNKSGISNWCKACNTAKLLAWAKNNPDKYRLILNKYYQKNKEKIGAQRRDREKKAYQHTPSIREKRKARRQAFYQKNKEKIKAQNKARYQRYYQQNREAILLRKRQYWAKNRELKKNPKIAPEV